jgi:hypothetical protein
MREELAEAVATLFAAPLSEPDGMTNEEIERLDGVCGLAIHLRAHVGRHRHYRDIEAVHDPEGPARLGLCLERLFVGIIAIGLSRGEAMRIIENIALDSCPQNRREAFNLLSETPKSTREIAEDMNLPTNTARRVLEDITAQGLAVRTRKKAAAEADGSDEEELFDGKATVKKKKGGSSVDLWAVHPNWAAWSASSRA